MACILMCPMNLSVYAEETEEYSEIQEETETEETAAETAEETETGEESETVEPAVSEEEVPEETETVTEEEPIVTEEPDVPEITKEEPETVEPVVSEEEIPEEIPEETDESKEEIPEEEPETAEPVVPEETEKPEKEPEETTEDLDVSDEEIPEKIPEETEITAEPDGSEKETAEEPAETKVTAEPEEQSDPEKQEEEESEEPEETAEEESVPKTAIEKHKTYDRTVEGFVARLYHLCLNRDYDQGGLNNWVKQLKSKTMSAAAVASSFCHSREMFSRGLTNEEITDMAYHLFLDRDPDPSGFAHWKGALDDGATIDYIINGFSGSQEFKGICAYYGVEPGYVQLTNVRDQNLNVNRFVGRLYKLCLGRPYDISGLENWLKQLLSGARSGAEVVSSFMNSQELQNMNLSDKEFVKIGYEAILGRKADSSGLSHWLSYLKKGLTRQYILYGFCGSQEFKGLCDKYGVWQGSVSLYDIRDLRPKVTMFVARLYEKCMNRTFDTQGLTNWVSQLAAGRYGGAEVAIKFFSSPEMAEQNLSDQEFLEAAYHAVLNRDPDESGMKTWTKKLKAGTSRDKVISDFTGSQEFIDLCGSYGIIVTTSHGSMIAKLRAASSDASIQGFGGYTPGASVRDSLQKAVNAVQSTGNRIGFIMMDIATGKGISYNPDVRLYSASSIKAFYIAALGAYNPSAVNASKDLILQTLTVSSDAAYHQLCDLYGPQPYEQWKQESDVYDPVNSQRFADYTPRDMAKMWARTYSFFTSGEFGAEMGTWYQSPSSSAIRDSVGKWYTTRSKAGYIWYAGYNAANDGGIVYADNGPYIVAVMSDMPGSLDRLVPVVDWLEAAHNEMMR